MVMALLKERARDDVNVKFGAQQESALHVAAEHGAEQVSSTLMLSGEDPHVLADCEQTPLHLAAQGGHDGVVNKLLLKGADPNASRELGGQTSIHLAAAGGHVRCVSKLMVGGADKNSRNSLGATPLFVAALYSRVRVFEELLAAGANFRFVSRATAPRSTWR